ncbi:MAG: nitrilase-related carbon-nitrogen hydrolase [Promethearchaeota archaeon]
MKIGFVQSLPIFGNKESNFKEIEKLIAGKKIDLLVLPELFSTGYTFISKEEAETLAEDKNGLTAEFLQDIAKKINGVVVGGFAEKNGSKLYNSAMMVNEESVLSVYRKIHLYYKEKLWFQPGNLPLRVVEGNGIKIGMMICFDWIFPETMRMLSLLGAEVIAHPANLVLPYCQKAMTTRCLENRVYAITANRIGLETRGDDQFLFTGKSQITSIDGYILSSAPEDEIYVDVVEIDVEKARNKKLNEFNDLFKDRRPEFYKF